MMDSLYQEGQEIAYYKNGALWTGVIAKVFKKYNHLHVITNGSLNRVEFVHVKAIMGQEQTPKEPVTQRGQGTFTYDPSLVDLHKEIERFHTIDYALDTNNRELFLQYTHKT